MFTIDGATYDLPDAVRGFQMYSAEHRATHQASFRLTIGQRNSVGEAFWTHPLVDGVCFKTRAEARRAAIRQLSVCAK